mgnify:CR=1 FL=1
MRKIFFGLVVLMIALSQTAQATPSPQWVKDLYAARTAEQMVVVAWIQGTTAWISMHERINGDWEQIMTTPGFIGKNGLGKTMEGDHKTPVGTFYFDCAFGIAPDPGCAMPYTQVNENHYWSGNWHYKYNKLVDVREAPANFDTKYTEHLIDYNPHYLYALNMGYNADCTPAKGFALFMHCFGPKNPYTLGCVGLPESKMLFIMQHIRPGCACVIDSLENLGGSI